MGRLLLLIIVCPSNLYNLPPFRIDGQTIIADNSNSIQVDYDPVYITNAPLIEKIDKNTKLIPALL